MNISDRDMRLLTWLARLEQMRADQIHALVFPDCRSRTSSDNRIHALMKLELITRVERQRLVGGSRGGGGQYVYQLDRRGWLLFNEGEYKRSRRVRHHQLLLGDAIVRLSQMQRDGLIGINYLDVGDEAAHKYDGVEVRPDLRIGAARGNQEYFVWLEVDMGTEGKRQVQDKMMRLWDAMKQTDPNEYPTAPICVWLSVDEIRARELTWVINHTEDVDGWRQWFSVCTLEDLETTLLPVEKSATLSA